MSFSVYLLIGYDHKPIYVGESENVKSRLADHRRDKIRYAELDGRTKREATRTVDVIDCADEDDMHATETRLIRLHRPVLNKRDNFDWLRARREREDADWEARDPEGFRRYRDEWEAWLEVNECECGLPFGSRDELRAHVRRMQILRRSRGHTELAPKPS